MFVIKEATSHSEGPLGPRFDSAADAHYYLLRHLRRRYPLRGYDETKRAYWGSERTNKSVTHFSVTRPSRPSGETGD